MEKETLVGGAVSATDGGVVEEPATEGGGVANEASASTTVESNDSPRATTTATTNVGEKRSPSAVTRTMSNEPKRSKHDHDGSDDEAVEKSTTGKSVIQDDEEEPNLQSDDRLQHDDVDDNKDKELLEDSMEEEEEESDEEDSEEEDSDEEEDSSGDDDEEQQQVEPQKRGFNIQVFNLDGNSSNNEVVPPLPAPPKEPIVPRNHDVLLAPQHGTDFRQFEGNMRLAFLIKQEGANYHGSSKEKRAVMIQGVVKLVQKSGGRFLKLDREKEEWIEVPDEYAHMQVLQMFMKEFQQKQQSGAAAASTRQQQHPRRGGDDGDKKPVARETIKASGGDKKVSSTQSSAPPPPPSLGGGGNSCAGQDNDSGGNRQPHPPPPQPSNSEAAYNAENSQEAGTQREVERETEANTESFLGWMRNDHHINNDTATSTNINLDEDDNLEAAVASLEVPQQQPAIGPRLTSRHLEPGEQSLTVAARYFDGSEERKASGGQQQRLAALGEQVANIYPPCQRERSSIAEALGNQTARGQQQLESEINLFSRWAGGDSTGREQSLSGDVLQTSVPAAAPMGRQPPFLDVAAGRRRKEIELFARLAMGEPVEGWEVGTSDITVETTQVFRGAHDRNDADGDATEKGNNNNNDLRQMTMRGLTEHTWLNEEEDEPITRTSTSSPFTHAVASSEQRLCEMAVMGCVFEAPAEPTGLVVKPGHQKQQRQEPFSAAKEGLSSTCLRPSHILPEPVGLVRPWDKAPHVQTKRQPTPFELLQQRGNNGASAEDMAGELRSQSGQSWASPTRCTSPTADSQSHNTSLERIVPRVNDVLMSDGGNSLTYFRHPGNVNLRLMARELGHKYLESSRAIPHPLIQRLVDRVHAMNPPGRFLERSSNPSKWRVVDLGCARQKAAQAFKELFCNRATMSPTERSQALRLLMDLQKHRHGWVFSEPIDPVELGLPNYFDIIKEPMDLGTIRKKLQEEKYPDMMSLRKDICLVFDNAMEYNEVGSVVYDMAKELKAVYETCFRQFEPPHTAKAQTGRVYDAPRVVYDSASSLEGGADEFGCVTDECCYDDAVVEVAKYNYESYYGLPHGTASFGLVQGTSAGIEGWAASVVPEQQENKPQEPSSTHQSDSSQWEKKEEAAVEGGCASAAVGPVETTRRRKKGDDEEARLLQVALLESVGAHPIKPEPKYDVWDYESDVDDGDDNKSEYTYEDDSSCQWDNEEEEEDVGEDAADRDAKNGEDDDTQQEEVASSKEKPGKADEEDENSKPVAYNGGAVTQEVGKPDEKDSDKEQALASAESGSDETADYKAGNKEQALAGRTESGTVEKEAEATDSIKKPVGARKVVKTSWQFQQLMNQVSSGREQDDAAAFRGNESGGAGGSEDQGSWSEISGGGSRDDGSIGSESVVVVPPQQQSSDAANAEDWQHVGEADRSDSEGDWSELSEGELRD